MGAGRRGGGTAGREASKGGLGCTAPCRGVGRGQGSVPRPQPQGRREHWLEGGRGVGGRWKSPEIM